MSALLGDPCLLASYPTPSQKITQPGDVGHSKRSDYSSATCSSNSHGEEFVTVSVQGNGIHVLDLSSMHAIASHTLGPSAFFVVPAVTRFDDSDTTTSYAVMQSAPDGTDSKERRRTVWRWRDHQSKRPDEPTEPTHSVFPRIVEHIWAPRDLPSHVIALSPSGEVMLSDEALNTISSGTAPDTENVLLKSFVFKLDECAFLVQQKDQTVLMVVMCFLLRNKRLKLRITFASSIGELTDGTDCDLGVQENVLDISCDSSGYVSILNERGQWQLLRLRHDSAVLVTAKPLDGPLHLIGLSLPPLSGSGHRVGNGPALLSVGTSHVLVAGIVSGPSAEIVLLLWDIQYSVVLASQTRPLPSTVMHTPKSPANFKLVLASQTQALLVLSPAPSPIPQRNTDAISSRSTVLIIPLRVSPASTIALAMGKARDTQRWLQNTHNAIGGIHQTQSCCPVMQSVVQALEEGQSQTAEAAFFAWVEEETSRLKQLRENDVFVDGNENENENSTDDGVGLRLEHKIPDAKGNRKKEPTKPVLSHQFVSAMLGIVLSPSKRGGAPYPSKIVLYLIDRKAVGHAMVEDGLLSALRLRRDWEGIMSALRNVPDIPETDLVKLLSDVVTSHRQRCALHRNKMQVDALDSTPSLTHFLYTFANYATSPPMLRLALKQHLTDSRDIVCVLEVLEGWVRKWGEKTWDLETTQGDPSADRSQPSTHAGKEKVSKTRMPSLEHVVSFLQSMLDTYFINLLQYSPSHSIMERLTQHLRQHLIYIDELNRLRGPLESFVRAELKQARLKRARQQIDGDWRKKRKEVREATEPAVGLYQIEDLVI